jgi:hypothetical protein
MDEEPWTNTPERRIERLRVLWWELVALCGGDQAQAAREWRAALPNPAHLKPATPLPLAEQAAWQPDHAMDRRIVDVFEGLEAVEAATAAREGRKPASKQELVERTVEALGDPDTFSEVISVSERTVWRLLRETRKQ